MADPNNYCYRVRTESHPYGQQGSSVFHKRRWLTLSTGFVEFGTMGCILYKVFLTSPCLLRYHFSLAENKKLFRFQRARKAVEYSNKKKEMIHDVPPTCATVYWPGAINMPFFAASGSQPPASASPPLARPYSLTRASSSGRKCRIRPWMGQANASPRAIDR